MKYEAEYKANFTKLVTRLKNNWMLRNNPNAAEDTVQDFFMRLQSSNPTIEDGKFFNYAYIACLNIYRNYYRAQANKIFAENESLENVAEMVSYNPEDDYIAKISVDSLQPAISKLSYEQRRAIKSALAGNVHQDLAASRKRNYYTAKANYRHAIVKLRKAVL